MFLRFSLEIEGETVETATNYNDFIRRLRSRLRVRYSHNVPVLTPETNPQPAGFCDMIIQTSTHSVRFRLRIDNLYLIGYQTLDGVWLEFRRTDGRHLIQGSTYLAFDCSYPRILHYAGLRMTQVQLGLEILESAVRSLAVEGRDQYRARGVVVVILMICEGARFIPIAVRITSEIAFTVPDYMNQLVNNWGHYSGALARADAYPEEKFMLPPGDHVVIPGQTVISTLGDVASILGLMMGYCFTTRPRTSLRLAIEGQCFVGVPMLEVFSVSVNYVESSAANLMGNVTTTNGPYTMTIYERTPSNPELISPDTRIGLSGPSQQPLVAFSAVSIILKLYLEGAAVDPFIDGTIVCDALNLGTPSDQRLSTPLDNPRGLGSVTVNWAVLRNAVSATVIVNLRQSYELRTEVYGDIYAYYDDWHGHGQQWQDPLARSSLFHIQAPSYASVDRGRNIPLSRSVVAVPLNSNSLKVTAHLRNYDTAGADDVIVDHTFEFAVPDAFPFAYAVVEDSTEIGGNVVRVIVSWSPWY